MMSGAATLTPIFSRDLSREQRLASSWQHQTSDLMAAARCTELLQHLLQAGSINQSGYAQLCGVGLATASKQRPGWPSATC